MNKDKQMTVASIRARVEAMPESLVFSEGFYDVFAHPTRRDEIVLRPTSKMTAKRFSAWLCRLENLDDLTMRNGNYSRVRADSPLWIATIDDESEPLTVERFDRMWMCDASERIVRKARDDAKKTLDCSRENLKEYIEEAGAWADTLESTEASSALDMLAKCLAHFKSSKDAYELQVRNAAELLDD